MAPDRSSSHGAAPSGDPATPVRQSNASAASAAHALLAAADWLFETAQGLDTDDALQRLPAALGRHSQVPRLPEPHPG